MKTYNHAFTIAFAVKGSTTEDGSELNGAQIRQALLEYVRQIPDDELVSCVGVPFDSFEETPPPSFESPSL